MLRRKNNKLRTDNHFNVMKKLVVEGGDDEKRHYPPGHPASVRQSSKHNLTHLTKPENCQPKLDSDNERKRHLWEQITCEHPTFVQPTHQHSPNSRFLPLSGEIGSHCQTLSFLLDANRIPERQRCNSRQSLPLSTQSVWSFKSLFMCRARTGLLRPFKGPHLLDHLQLLKEGSDEMQNQSREYTLPRRRSILSERVDSRKHEKRPGVGCEGLPSSKTLRYRNHGRIPVSRQVSWVRIVNGIDKNVTETSETISFDYLEHRVAGKPVAKAKPQSKPTVTLSPVSIPVRERNWTDINPGKFRQDYFTVSKAMIRLLRHDPSIAREDDGAVRFDDIMEKSRQSSMVVRNGQ